MVRSRVGQLAFRSQEAECSEDPRPAHSPPPWRCSGLLPDGLRLSGNRPSEQSQSADGSSAGSITDGRRTDLLLVEPRPRSVDCSLPRSGRHGRPIPSNILAGKPCDIERSAGRAGRSARSATGCGGWRAGPAPRTRIDGRARARRRARLHVLRHRLGLRRGAERGTARQLVRAHPEAALDRRDQDPARRTSRGPRGGASPSTIASRPTTSASMPRRAWRTSACRGSTCSSSTSGKTPGPGTSAGNGRWTT